MVRRIETKDNGKNPFMKHFDRNEDFLEVKDSLLKIESIKKSFRDFKDFPLATRKSYETTGATP